MTKTFTIETERLILRRWNECDIDALVDGLGKFDVAKNLTVPFPYTRKNAQDFLKICNSNENNFHFAITLKENGCVIGGTSIEIDSRTHGGIWLNEKFVGKGYGTEVWVARANFGFEKLGLTKLENGFFDFNDRSWNMQRKVGYRIVGERTNYSQALKSEVTEKLTVLTKDDFYKILNKG